MMASIFGLGRMMRSVADEGHAPGWLKDKKDVPYRGIIFSGFAMLAGLGLGLLFPSVYLFLISSGGFATLLTYAAIVATHIRFRKCNGCPPNGKCQMPGYPVTSWIALISLLVIIISMPLIPGQTSGLITGIVMTAVYAVIYLIMKAMGKTEPKRDTDFDHRSYRAGYSHEFSEELSQGERMKKNRKNSYVTNKSTSCQKCENKPGEDEED
jgi:L-asparagine transporter-like permease